MQLETTSRWHDNWIELFVLQVADVNSVYVSWLNNPLVNCYLESRFSAHTIESTRNFVSTCLADPATLFLGIKALQFGRRHVGNIKLSPIDWHHKRGEVGIMIGASDVWGQGIASRAISLLMNIARDELDLRKLTAGCYASNVGSQKAFLKAGFQVECRRKGHFLSDGELEDLILMGCFLR